MASSLYTVVLNQIAQPQDLNQVVNVLSQPSGGIENGVYWLAFESYANGVVGSQFMQSLSRNNAPVSVTKDESLYSHSNCGTIQVGATFYNGGVQFYAFSNNGAQGSCNVAGLYSFHY